MKNGGWRLFAVVALLHVLIYCIFVDERYLVSAMQTEHALNQRVLGDEIAIAVHNRGQGWYESAFVQTGVAANVFGMYVPDAADWQAAGPALDGVGKPIFDWFEQRLRVLFTLMFVACLRIAAAFVWMPYMALVAAPCLIDGVLIRKIRQTTFDFQSPLRNSLGVSVVGLVATLVLLMILAPLPMPTFVAPICLAAIALAARLFIANLLKRT